jgi:PEGA domain
MKSVKIFKIAYCVVPALFAGFLGGCATVTRGTTNQIQIESEPSGASVATSLNHQCTTPCTLTVNRKDEFTVTFKMDGFKEQQVFVKTILSPDGIAGAAGNVLIGGVVGLGVDAATGSTLMHTPNPIKVVLERSGPAPKALPKSKQKVAPKAKAAPSPAPTAEEPKPEGES